MVHGGTGSWRPGSHRDALIALHDTLFPGAHRSGAQIAAADYGRVSVMVATSGAELAGYAVGELHPGAIGFIDFVGVAPAHRQRGFGRELIVALASRLFAAGAERIDLTVRESNAGARALYASLGFEELRLVRPYRKGFELA